MSKSSNGNRNRRRQKGGKRRPGPSGNNPSQQPQSAPQRELPEFVLNGEMFAHTATVTPGHMPLYWQAAGFIQLLKPGLYLRYRGGLSEITKKFSFPKAVLFALWEDPDASYQVGRDRWVQPGANAGFLVPNPLNEGPPWLPLQGRVKVDGDELDVGLLSSWVDQIHCVPFKATLSPSKDGMLVASEGRLGDDFDGADAALLDTLRWLRDHPDDDSTAAVTARMMLIEQGHGLHRAGISLTHRDEDTSRELLDELLPAFAPDVAPVIKEIWNVWHGQNPGTMEAVEQLARVLQPHLNDRSPLQRNENLAVLITWISGIFGSRPDRHLHRPSRSLFAVMRYLRQLNGRADLFGHADAQPPTFPLNHTETKAILLDLSRFPDKETDFERLVRAMAIGESTHDFGRPNLDHIRPFKIGLPRVNDYPIATKTLMSRYDGILTAWSFRGLELNRDNIDPAHLSANLILETTSTAGVRGIARVLGSEKAIAPALEQAISLNPRFGPGVHPHYRGLLSLAKKSLPEIVEQAEKASRAGKAYENRLLDGLSAHEYLVSRNDNTGDDGGYHPIAPEWGDDVEYPVRRQFMFWRAFCRSIQWGAPEVYGEFFDGMLPRLDELPANLENEALALLRNWLRRDDSHLERARPWTELLGARARTLIDRFEADDARWDERYSSLFAALAILDRAVFCEQLERLAGTGAWDFEDLGRILEGVRHAGWQDELVDEPVFRVLHARLIDARGPHAGLGRVEWTRKALERANQAHAIRWFVHRDKFPQIVFSPSFNQWFADHGLRAIAKPDDGVIEILQVAVRTIDEAQLDVLLHHIARSTSWPDREILRELLDAGRFQGAAEWLQGRGRASVENVAPVFAGLFDGANSAEDLRRIARLIRFCDQRGIDAVGDARERLAERLAGHPVTPDLPLSAGSAADAWRIAGLNPTTEPGTRFGVDAAKWYVRTGDHRLVAYVAYLFECTFRSEFEPAIRAAIRDADDARALGMTLFELRLPDNLIPIANALEQLSSRSQKGQASYSAMVSATWARQIQAATHAAVLETLSASEDIASFAAALPTILENLESGWHQTKRADAQTDHDGADDAATDDAATDDAPAAETLAEPRSAFVLDVTENAAKGLIASVFETLTFWNRALSEETSPPSNELARQLLHYCRTELIVRQDLFACVKDLARQLDLKIADPRRLLRTDFLDTSTELDAYDFETLLHWLAGLREVHDSDVELTVNRRSVEIALIPREATLGEEHEVSDGSDASTAPGDGAADAQSDGDDDENAAIAGADEDGHDEPTVIEEEDDRGDESEDDRDESTDTLGALLKAGWAKGASTEQRRLAFGQSADPWVARALIERNEALRLTIQGARKRPRFVLSWRDFRPS